MFSYIVSGFCCPEPVAPAEVVYSDTDERQSGALPNLLPGSMREDVKVKAYPVLSAASAAHDEGWVSNAAQKNHRQAATQGFDLQDNGEKPGSGATMGKSANILDPSSIPPAGHTALDRIEELGSPGSRTARSTPAQLISARSSATRRSEVGSKELVRDFVKRSSQATPCIFFDEHTGKRQAATYKFDVDTNQLTLQSTKAFTMQRVLVKCAISAIQDADDFDGCNLCFAAAAKHSLSAEDRDRVLMVFYDGSKGKMKSFCILEESRERRDTFLKAVRSLAISARASEKR